MDDNNSDRPARLLRQEIRWKGCDGRSDATDEGQVESLWVVEPAGRQLVKAWNAIGAFSFHSTGEPLGDLARIAVSVASDRDETGRSPWRLSAKPVSERS